MDINFRLSGMAAIVTTLEVVIDSNLWKTWTVSNDRRVKPHQIENLTALTIGTLGWDRLEELIETTNVIAWD